MWPGAYLHVKNRKWAVSLTRDVRFKCCLALSYVKKCNGKVFCLAHGSDSLEKDDFWPKHGAFASNHGSGAFIKTLVLVGFGVFTDFLALQRG